MSNVNQKSADTSAKVSTQATLEGNQPNRKATDPTHAGKPAQEGQSGKGDSPKNRKRTKQNLKGFTPMVRYDSQSHVIAFTRKGSVNNTPVTTDPVYLDLDHLDESTRQAVIAAVKFTMSFCNGLQLEDKALGSPAKQRTESKSSSEDDKSNPLEDPKGGPVYPNPTREDMM